MPHRYTGRFAPSPTGDLHAGSVLAALGSWLFARRAGGTWHVRIENIDPPREVAGASERQLRTLDAFGLVPDGPVLRQSMRGDAYRHALQTLLDAGLAFHCHCSRRDLDGAGGVHRACVPGVHRGDPAVRLQVAAGDPVEFTDVLQGPQSQDVAREVGDVVLRRADGLWAYQLAVVVDDAWQGVTEVVRGHDLLASTGRQMLLQRALGLTTPRYAHLPLVRDREGRKLSKSDAAQPVDPDRPLPTLTSAWSVLGQDVHHVLGANTPGDWLRRALDAFDPARIPREPLDAAAHHTGVASAD